MKIKLLTLVFLLLSLLGQSQVRVTVMAVHDGDSYNVKFEDGSKEWIRLYGVDCPEVISNHITKNQPYGVQTGDHVRSLLKGKQVTIDTLKRDPYDRLVSKVLLNDSTDLSTYLVRNGYAWSLVKAYDQIQKNAKQSKIGLWGLSGRKLKPATFRKKNWRK